VSRRGRALGFAASAGICAAIAAAASGGGPGAAARYGALREVAVAARPLPARRELDRRVVERSVEIRRVPEAFVPTDALANPAQVLGRRPAIAIPAGGYLLASQFAAPQAPQPSVGSNLAPDRQPVEIAVAGAAALAGSARGRVDVVVTTEAGAGGGPGRTYVAAETVRLLDLTAAAEGEGADPLAPAGSGAWVATLALIRGQALRLIHAQSFAREVRLIGA
jgi:Flp pilus assembly protein CpaB